jgi:hypothetical protein
VAVHAVVHGTLACGHNPANPFLGKVQFGGPLANTANGFSFHEIRMHNEYQSDATFWATFSIAKCPPSNDEEHLQYVAHQVGRKLVNKCICHVSGAKRARMAGRQIPLRLMSMKVNQYFRFYPAKVERYRRNHIINKHNVVNTAEFKVNASLTRCIQVEKLKPRKLIFGRFCKFACNPPVR